MGTLFLSERSNDSDRTAFVETVIGIIDKDLFIMIVQRKASLLRDFNSCTRNYDESLACFANRFCLLVSRYPIQTGRLDSLDNKQFAVLMLQKTNFLMTQDHFFELATDSKTMKPVENVPVPGSLVQRILSSIQPQLKNSTEAQSLEKAFFTTF